MELRPVANRSHKASGIVWQKKMHYQAPPSSSSVRLWKLLEGIRDLPPHQRERLSLPGVTVESSNAGLLYYAGNIDLVKKKCVAIVGSRKVSPEGSARARRLARELAAAGVVVVSGLAEGVDTHALRAAMEAGGSTIAVIGTPLDRVYPRENGGVQEEIYRNHLLVSPFPAGAPVARWNFPHRNKVMAAISDATVIVEASDTSGSLHQAAECQSARLNRWLFIARSVVDNPNLTWPKRFLGKGRVKVLERIEDILSTL